MVGLLLENDKAKIIVEVGFFDNDTVPSLRFSFIHGFTSDLDKVDAISLARLIKTAESNVKGIFLFDKKYNHDCLARITETTTIEKFCCDDDDDSDYIVEFPNVRSDAKQ